MDFKRLVWILMVCVAAITLSACGADPPPVDARPAPAPSSAQQIPAPAGYDELENWSSGETLPEIDAAVALMGLSGATIPKASYIEQGFVGVAPLEEGCIVVFSALAASSDSGRLSAVILSRYDLSLNVVQADSTPQEIKVFVDSYRATCGNVPGAPA